MARLTQQGFSEERRWEGRKGVGGRDEEGRWGGEEEEEEEEEDKRGEKKGERKKKKSSQIPSRGPSASRVPHDPPPTYTRHPSPQVLPESPLTPPPTHPPIPDSNWIHMPLKYHCVHDPF